LRLQSTVGSRAFQNARLQKKSRKQAEALLPAAIAAYREGRHSDAQALCRRLLEGLPNHFDALHLLGVSELDCGRFEEAATVLTRAVSVDPQSAEACSNLGLVLFKLKRYDEARRCQEKAIALQPNFPTALTNLGNALMRLKLAEQAIQAHDRAIRLKPDYADAYCNRGMAELLLYRNEEASQSFDRALSLRPRHVEAVFGRALVDLNLRHFEAAESGFNAALAMKPGVAEILAHRGLLHLQLGRFVQAGADFDAALALAPELEPAWQGKAQIGIHSGNVAQAIKACKKLLEQDPNSEIGIALLGNCFAKQGEIAAAIEHFDRALAIKPDYESAITTKIFALDFVPDADFAIQQAARRSWWDAIGARIPRRTLQPRQFDPQKQIVIGYVSSDFRDHSAAFAFMPVLRRHDHANLRIICYSCSPIQDAVTTEAQSFADDWVDAAGLSDDELADRIQADGVDILVDLSGHSAGNRLKVLARKPAPIQISAWGHPTGTGLPTVDYVFADPVSIPEAVRHLFAERIYDLPCVITMETVPGLHRPAGPMMRNGYVTFGVFNRIEKISDGAMAAWSKLLTTMAGSRIVVKHGALDDPLIRDGLIGRFLAYGVSEDSIRCIGATSRRDHLSMFEAIDISLDPFPQNGGISTWESLHMGVPVIAKLGNSVSSRAAGAILKAIGLDDWVADDDDGYIAIARKYASMPSHLEMLRAELPAKIANSDTGNFDIYTRKVEEGYRQFWRDYCASKITEQQ
jgi:predicted O-linked N-acetylglucosamine transferase (SPINDLY family)